MSTTVLTDVNVPVAAGRNKDSVNQQVFGKKLGMITRVFGCRHRNLSRPFSQARFGYRACINCGARKQFNPKTLETHGAFYAAPAAGEAKHF